MKATITLGREGASLSSSTFVQTEDKTLVLEFESVYDLSEAVITLKNGALEKRYDFKKQFTVPDEFMNAGRLLIRVTLYVSGDPVKAWNISPIKLKEVDEQLYAYDELNDILTRIEALEEATKIIL